MKGITWNVSKILLSLAMVFAMVFTIIPTNVFASSNEIDVNGNNGYTLTADGLNKAVTDVVEGGTITLGGNITTSDYIFHGMAKNIILDLNGYTITTSATYGVIVSNGAGITIRSSQEGGKIVSSRDTIRNVAGTASITIESGSIISSGQGTAINIANEGNIIVTGGTISSGTGEAISNYKGDVTISGSSTITSACDNVNFSTIEVNNGTLTVSGTPTISNAGSGQYGYCLSLLKGNGTISGGTISAKDGIAIRALAPLTISGSTIVTSENPLTSNGTIMAAATLTLTDTTQVSNFTTDGNAIYLLGSSASYSFSDTNVVGKIAPSYDISGTITGSDTSSGIAATLQLKQSNGVAIGNTVTAISNGSYSVRVPQGTGYTIAVSMAGYTPGTIGPFNVGNSAQTGKNLTLTKNLNDDKDKVDEAKPIAEAAITAITTTNTTTAGNILDAVATAIASVDGVVATWKTEPNITPATKDNTGSIIGIIVLTCGSETVEISVHKTIAQLPISDKDKVDEAKPIAEAAITAITTTNTTTAGNILDVVATAIASVDGVVATWKTEPNITPATKDNEGSITGTLLLTCGSETLEVTVRKAIEKLTTPKPERPTITVGGGFNYQVSTGKDITLTCSGKLEDLTGIYVDGLLVDKSQYTLKSGSTILTLKTSYLNTLAVGKHALRFQYKDNISAETNFTIMAQRAIENDQVIKDTSSVKTSATSSTLLFLSFAVLTGCVTSYNSKKKKAIKR